MGAKVQEVRICEANNIPITGEPMGDIHYSSAVVLTMPNEPDVADVIRVARGEWIYRIMRISLSIDRPSIGMHLAVDPHPSFTCIRREYLYPTDIMPQFKEGMFKGTYNAVLENYYYQIAVLMLPGDKIFMSLYSKEPFRGELRILSC